MYRTVIVINSATLGRGDEEVGHTLIGTFLRKILASLEVPDVIIFYNSGVKLVIKGSYFGEILQSLEEKGVELLACGTCVFKACNDKALVAGRITNMEEIADILLQSEKVITL